MPLQLSGCYLVGAIDWICRCSYLVVIWLVQLIGYRCSYSVVNWLVQLFGYSVAIICSYVDIMAVMHDDVPGSGYLI